MSPGQPRQPGKIIVVKHLRNTKGEQIKMERVTPTHAHTQRGREERKCVSIIPAL